MNAFFISASQEQAHAIPLYGVEPLPTFLFCVRNSGFVLADTTCNLPSAGQSPDQRQRGVSTASCYIIHYAIRRKPILFFSAIANQHNMPFVFWPIQPLYLYTFTSLDSHIQYPFLQAALCKVHTLGPTSCCGERPTKQPPSLSKTLVLSVAGDICLPRRHSTPLPC